MKVVSGAGEFEISVERVEIRDTTVVMVGKMGVWEAETYIERDEIWPLVSASLSPGLIGWMLLQPFRALLDKLRGQSSGNGRDPDE